MPRLPTPWIKPVSVDPALFVNRAQDLARFTERLTDLVDYESRAGLVVVRGDRGVGKSIFVRRALADLREARAGHVLTVVVDYRGGDERQMLLDLIRKLVQAALKTPELSASAKKDWIEPLQALEGAGDRIVRGASETTSRELGVTGQVGADLWTLLKASFSAHWKDRVDLGKRQDSTLEITSEVLRVALCGGLEALAKQLTVIVFFDDLDQARNMENPEHAKRTFRSVLDIAPCISILHLRSEVASFADFRREVDDTIELQGLTSDQVMEIFQSRVRHQAGPHTLILSDQAALAPFRALAQATSNPYVHLRWSKTLAEQFPNWPPPVGWSAPGALIELAVAALNGPRPETNLLQRLAAVLAAVGHGRSVTPEQLLAGGGSLSARPENKLSAEDIESLKRFELLVPVDRFDPRAGLRLDPLLALILPAAAARVTEAPSAR